MEVNWRYQKVPREVGSGTPYPELQKGDTNMQMKYRPVFMLSCARNIRASAIEDRILKILTIGARKFVFQRVFSPTISLLDVDAVVRAGREKIAALDMPKAYDKVVRKQLLQDCAKVLRPSVTSMLTACLQILKVTTKGDTRGVEAGADTGGTYVAYPVRNLHR